MVVLPRWREKKRLIKFKTWQIMPKGRGNVISEEGERMRVFGDTGIGNIEASEQDKG